MSSDRHAPSNSASPDDNYLFIDVSTEAPLCGHRKRASIIGSILYCILLAIYATLAIGAPWVLKPEKYLTLQILCTCDVVLLIITGVFQQYMVYQVQKIRLQGYYIFSQKLKHIVRLPFACTSYGTGAMLLIMVWEPNIRILPIPMILRIIMVLEAILAGFFMSVYIGNVHQYNTLDSQPDVLKSLYSPLQPSSSLEGLRYHDGGRLSDQQMALLQYQRENLNFLSDEILRLKECLSKYERSGDGMTPQVDLAHLLAARDQEIRTLSAEMNQLQSELRLARSLVAEKEAEIQGVRNTNNQYMEENERLRAILGEWSTRAAKLERALEAERMSKLELHKKMSTIKSQHPSS
ncbi:protein FIP1-like [Rutidosis leptorrhynchoides]|uniref:protein FIP1-like n=1 Tax=Rutidosis leptorrhynchoides TaxID=125765 RepID=UPI003A98DD03